MCCGPRMPWTRPASATTDCGRWPAHCAFPPLPTRPFTMPSTADIRQTYQKFELLESSAAADPHEQFDRWFQQAPHSEVPEPTAMTLATADAQARPSARTVLLKGY